MKEMLLEKKTEALVSTLSVDRYQEKKKFIFRSTKE